MLTDYQKAEITLKALRDEKIKKDAKALGKRITEVRNLVDMLVETQAPIAPRLTAMVATTLTGVGLCQELTQRYVLEYAIRHKEQNLKLIFTDNSKNIRENHVFVVVGDINVPENLFIGKTDTNISANPLTFTKFLEMNKNILIVDPLLDCLGSSKEQLAPLFAFNEKNNIDRVVGVRCYKNTLKFVDFAPTVKLNAEKIANSCSRLMSGLAKENNAVTKTQVVDKEVDASSVIVKLPELSNNHNTLFIKELSCITPSDLAGEIKPLEGLDPADLAGQIKSLEGLNPSDLAGEIKPLAMRCS